MAEIGSDWIVDMPETGDMKNDAAAQAKVAIDTYKIESKIS